MASDVDLLDRWRSGDRRAGDELYRRHFAAVYRFFRTKLGDDVDDMVQGTFLALVQQRDKFRGEGTFRAYLFAIARRRLLDHLRKLHRRPDVLDLTVTSLRDLGTTPSSAVARSEEEQRLLDALHKVPVDFRIALELAYWEDLKGPEIAVALGIPPNTVRSRLARARALLRDALQDVRASEQEAAP